jgi:hypothetical protein
MIRSAATRASKKSLIRLPQNSRLSSNHAVALAKAGRPPRPETVEAAACHAIAHAKAGVGCESYHLQATRLPPQQQIAASARAKCRLRELRREIRAHC